jgi:hypothetical protein
MGRYFNDQKKIASGEASAQQTIHSQMRHGVSTDGGLGRKDSSILG